MKKLLSIFLLFFALQCMAQGNLQFNQVINIKNGDTYTVPAGKVLKITGIANSAKTNFKIPLKRCDFSQGQAFCYYDPSNVFVGSIGNVEYFAAPNGSSNQSTGPYSQCSLCPPTYDYFNSYIPYVSSLPFWLNAGQNITIGQGSGYLISAIEFNIIP